MKPTLDVLVEFLSEEEGGRKDSLYTNGCEYKPHFRVIGDTEYLGVQFIGGPNEIVKPNKKVTAKVILLYYPEVSYDKLIKDTKFEILEGSRIVGIGKVI